MLPSLGESLLPEISYSYGWRHDDWSTIVAARAFVWGTMIFTSRLNDIENILKHLLEFLGLEKHRNGFIDGLSITCQTKPWMPATPSQTVLYVTLLCMRCWENSRDGSIYSVVPIFAISTIPISDVFLCICLYGRWSSGHRLLLPSSMLSHVTQFHTWHHSGLVLSLRGEVTPHWWYQEDGSKVDWIIKCILGHIDLAALLPAPILQSHVTSVVWTFQIFRSAKLKQTGEASSSWWSALSVPMADSKAEVRWRTYPREVVGSSSIM